MGSYLRAMESISWAVISGPSSQYHGQLSQGHGVNIGGWRLRAMDKGLGPEDHGASTLSRGHDISVLKRSTGLICATSL